MAVIYSPAKCSTINANELNFSVRNGKRGFSSSLNHPVFLNSIYTILDLLIYYYKNFKLKG